MRSCSSRFHLSLVLLICLACISSPSFSLSTESDQLGESNVTTESGRRSNSSDPKSKEDSFADMIDRALEKEFPENEQNGGLELLVLILGMGNWK
ncbi:hypothetical protein GIB67_021829 [Kingdonia uniflora]|uniref:Uncharacterized protein n=1 Tax=Kingdonia uniflora TaxID=39325 RepID=A0A7J7P840_9MAGN|nr:hypothetical protein GIB67_021829 [Kingdonia uniflora]